MLEYGKGRCADQRGYAKLLIHLRSSHIDTMARIIHCAKLDKEAEGFDLPPLPGKLWQRWLRHQTMLINENRLNMADARARKYLLKQTEKFFFGEGADVAAGYVPPKNI